MRTHWRDTVVRAALTVARRPREIRFREAPAAVKLNDCPPSEPAGLSLSSEGACLTHPGAGSLRMGGTPWLSLVQVVQASLLNLLFSLLPVAPFSLVRAIVSSMKHRSVK